MSNQKRMSSFNEEFSKGEFIKRGEVNKAFSCNVSVLHNSCDVIFGFRAQCTVSQSVVVGFASSFCGHIFNLTSNVCREEKRKKNLEDVMIPMVDPR